MENQNSLYRTAMRYLQTQLHPNSPPKVCTACAGWKSFGGTKCRDVSMGPICICNAHWHRLECLVRKLETMPAPISTGVLS